MSPESTGEADVAANVALVRERIAAACRRSGRDPRSVTLVGVTKSVGVPEATALVRAGVADLGENRTDALASKRSAFSEAGVAVRWHMIGHLQTNKVRRALPAIDVLHSLDRTSLLESLASELGRSDGPRLPAFVQVNVAGEASKGGFDEQGLPSALAAALAVPRLDVRGLMTMAPASADAETSRRVFRRLRELRDAALVRGYLHGLELSMGMSQDFEIAVEEGATHVRVGTILYTA
jgi:PLP dependent protein